MPLKTVNLIRPTMDQNTIAGKKDKRTQAVIDQDTKEQATNRLHLKRLGVNAESVIGEYFDVTKEFPTIKDTIEVIKDIMSSWFKGTWIESEIKSKSIIYLNKFDQSEELVFYLNDSISRYEPSTKLLITIEYKNKTSLKIASGDVAIKNGISDLSEFEKDLFLEINKVLKKVNFAGPLEESCVSLNSIIQFKSQ